MTRIETPEKNWEYYTENAKDWLGKVPLEQALEYDRQFQEGQDDILRRTIQAAKPPRT